MELDDEKDWEREEEERSDLVRWEGRWGFWRGRREEMEFFGLGLGRVSSSLGFSWRCREWEWWLEWERGRMSFSLSSSSSSTDNQMPLRPRPFSSPRLLLLREDFSPVSSLEIFIYCHAIGNPKIWYCPRPSVDPALQPSTLQPSTDRPETKFGFFK